MSQKPVRRPNAERGTVALQRRAVRIPLRRGGGAGDSYTGPVLLRVKSWDEHGRPSDVTICWDDDVVKLEGGEQFFTAFVSGTALPPKAQA
jgi:hypothetical protein